MTTTSSRALLFFSSLCLIAYSLHSQNILVTSQAQVSSRAIGMGSAFGGVSNDAAAFAYNPAGLSLEKSILLSGMYSSLHGTPGTPLANLTWAGISAPLSGFSISGNWIRFQSADVPSNPTIPVDDINAGEVIVKQNRVNSFLPQYEDALILTAARNNIVKIDWGWNQYVLPIEIPVGINLRYSRASLAGLSGNAFSVDAGAMVRINLRDMFFSDDYPYITGGWSLKNIGGSVLQWKNNHRDYMPYHSVVSFAVIQPLASLESQCIVDYDHDMRGTAASRLGIEWTYRKFYFARAGFYSSCFAFGFGVDLRFFMIDYAYQTSSSDILGNNHHLHLAFRLERLFL